MFSVPHILARYRIKAVYGWNCTAWSRSEAAFRPEKHAAVVISAQQESVKQKQARHTPPSRAAKIIIGVLLAKENTFG
jgi:hypothetical protein